VTPDDPLWDDLFHGSAWAAFIEVAQEQGGWPDSEATRRLAFRLYEEALRAKNAGVDNRPEMGPVLEEEATP
jgi:hypothetical protein